MKEKIAVLGAGLAGLSVAYHLADECVVYEQEHETGGLARTRVLDGFTFDIDGHLLHFKTGYAQRLISEILPGVFTSHKRKAWIYSQGTFTKYPFQANTYGLPGKTVKNCILGMFKVSAQDQNDQTKNFYDWMLRNFGKGITQYFMYPYNSKFWTMAPEVKLKHVLDGAFTAKTKPIGYNSEFWYPKAGGIDQIAKALTRKLTNINTCHRVKAIDIQKKKIYFEHGEQINYEKVVWSIPLVELKNLIANKIPRNVRNAFEGLRCISIFNLNLGIDRENITDKHWIYFPEDKYSFFRVGFPTNFSENVAPKGTSSLYSEVSYSHNKPLNKKTIQTKIISDLITCGILSKNDRILKRHINDIKYGYVVYDHQYRENLSVINDFLAQNDIYPIGRFGRWQYMSMEDVLLDGQAVAQMLKGVPCSI